MESSLDKSFFKNYSFYITYYKENYFNKNKINKDNTFQSFKDLYDKKVKLKVKKLILRLVLENKTRDFL